MVKNNKYLIGLIILFSFISCNQPKEDANWENLKKVKINMKYASVEKLMGKPDKMEVENDLIRCTYKASIGMSDDFYIMLSKTDSTVVRINDGQ